MFQTSLKKTEKVRYRLRGFRRLRKRNINMKASSSIINLLRKKNASTKYLYSKTVLVLPRSHYPHTRVLGGARATGRGAPPDKIMAEFSQEKAKVSLVIDLLHEADGDDKGDDALHEHHRGRRGGGTS